MEQAEVLDMQDDRNGYPRAKAAPTRRTRQVIVAAPPGHIDPAVSEALHIVDQPALLAEPQPNSQPDKTLETSYSLASLARVYEQILEAGLHVLSLQPPAPMDAHTRLALAARSVVAAQSAATRRVPQVVISETAAVGQGFAWLVQHAAEAARQGVSLEHILALLEHMQEKMTAFYITRWPGPVAASRASASPAYWLTVGQEQCWYIDYMQRRFVCQGHGWNLSRTLFRAGGTLEAINTLPLVCATDERLLARVVRAWEAEQSTPLPMAQASTSLASLFPRGCVELTLLPDSSLVQHISQALYREPEPAAPYKAGVRERVGF